MRKNWGKNSKIDLPDLLPEVNDFLKRLIGPSADELGLLSSASSFGLKTYTYPHMLNQLSPNEVNILDMLYQNYSNTRIELDIEWLNRETICSKLNITN